MPEHRSYQRHPLKSTIRLLLLMISGAVLFLFAGVAISHFLIGFPQSMIDAVTVSGTSGIQVNYLKIVQVSSTIGTFIIPAFLFARTETRQITSYLNLSAKRPPALFLLSIALIFFAGPLLELSISVNQQIHLPDFLKGIETWMRQQEQQLGEQVKILLAMHSVKDLLINLLMIAIIPGFGEEIFFRGCLQTIFIRWFKNYHAAIWLAAIIFSAFHMQFLGFLPRTLLGALLGYLYVWGKSIWFPVMAHLTNNAISVVVAYIDQKNGKPIDTTDNVISYSWYIYLMSAIFTIAALAAFYQISKNKFKSGWKMTG